MGKHGPCCHCGTHSTPLWRNGPPEKPVLCNACGSRYRIRGNLTNYAPKHAQGQPFAKRARINPKLASKKENFKSGGNSLTNSYCSSTSSGNEDDSATTKSNSESAISHPQDCYNVKEEDEDKVSGSIQESCWNCSIPSRKRSLSIHYNLTPIEKLQRDLCNILKHEKPSVVSENEDDLLIYNVNYIQIPCNEIGLGITYLLKPKPTSKQLGLNKTHSSLVDNKVLGYTQTQNISSSMERLQNSEPASDRS